MNGNDYDYGDIWCSVDGDVDRIVFYKIIPPKNALLSPTINLFDGDRITCLLVKYLQSVTKNLNLNIGAVQTGYANGASTKYLKKSLNVEVEVAKTGVKYLHSKCSKFDVGVYFEANGHGSIVFSKYVLKAITFDYNDEKLKREAMVSQALRSEATSFGISKFGSVFGFAGSFSLELRFAPSSRYHRYVILTHRRHFMRLATLVGRF